MIDTSQAREIASHWHSPSPHDHNITALSHGVDDQWTASGLTSEVARELSSVLSKPESYDDPIACRDELRLLLEWARSPEVHPNAKAESAMSGADAFCTTCAMGYPFETWPPTPDQLEQAERLHRQHDGAHYASWAGDDWETAGYYGSE